eukprot:563189-Lingulodinium_polyedra.AAC.1
MSPVGSHQSMGGIERANQELAGEIRALKTGLERHVGRLAISHPVMPWLVRHAAWVVTRFLVKASGRTPYELVKQRKYNGQIVCFGETVWARRPGDREAKLDDMWSEKTWAGKAEGSDEHLLLDERGLTRCRTIRRQPPSARWRRARLDSVRGT